MQRIVKAQPLAMLLLTLLTPICASAQDPHVHSEYLEKQKRTRVYTDALYVIDNPSQFMLVELSTSYPRQELKRAAEEATLLISSITRKSLYFQIPDLPSQRVIIIDGESVRFDRPSREVMEGGMLDGKAVFWGQTMLAVILNAREPKGYAMESPLPDDAQVRVSQDVKGLLMERLWFDLKKKRLAKLANASKIEFQLGKTRFVFTESQVNTIRAFVRAITPEKPHP